MKIKILLGITEDGKHYQVRGDDDCDKSSKTETEERCNITEYLGEKAPCSGIHTATIELDVKLPEPVVIGGSLDLSGNKLDLESRAVN